MKTNITIFIIAFAATAIADTKENANIAPALLAQLTEIDQHAAKIKSIDASFQQKRYAALLKKPVISIGRVRVVGSTVRWDTTKPHPTAMITTSKKVTLYYPKQKVVEEYDIKNRMADLTASPQPRLSVLLKHFKIEKAESKIRNTIALKLTPIDKSLEEHVSTGRVVIDTKTAVMREFEMTDAEGDRTVIAITKPKTNSGLKVDQLKLKLPRGTKIVRPMAAVKK